MKFTLMCFLLIVMFFSMTGSVKCDEEIIGAGASFPYPLYSKMFSHYHDQHGVRINYQAIGSGGGIRQLLNRTVEFGGTDAFMKKKELAKAKGEILHVPTCVGAIVLSYNLKGVPKLNLTPKAVAGIFLRKITSWNDPEIQKANPGAALPDNKIIVVHRSDGSGTTAIFSDWLCKVSPEWKNRVGCGKSLRWPVGLGQKGNQGVSGMIRNIPGAIGYCTYIYAAKNNIAFARIQNSSGKFIDPSLDSLSLAAQVKLPDDTRASITNTSAENGYPLCGFTWLILYKEQKYDGRLFADAKRLMDLIWWMLHDGQSLASPLKYGALPEQAVDKAEAVLQSVVYDGKTIL